MRLRGAAGARRVGRCEQASNLRCRNRAGITALGNGEGDGWVGRFSLWNGALETSANAQWQDGCAHRLGRETVGKPGPVRISILLKSFFVLLKSISVLLKSIFRFY